jgi:hypothetical protein
LGNTVESKFYPASYVSCALTLVTTPPTVYQGNNVTVLLTVTPNDTAVDSIQSLTATLNVTPANLVQLVGNSSLSVSGLARGTSAFFWWVYNTVNTGTVTFNATYLQAPAGTYALSTAQIVSPPQQGDVTITGINCTALQNPSQWNLTGATQNVTGSISDLASNDSSYAVFRSYYTGGTVYANTFVNNSVFDVDSKADIGTHSNFTAEQYGPDSIYDNLTEQAGGMVWLWQEDTSGYSSTESYETYEFWSEWGTNSTTSGKITTIGIYVFADPGSSPPQVKLGIYSDSSGNPGSLLGSTNAATVVGPGWLDLEIVSPQGGVSISPSTTYHVAHITSQAPTTQWRWRKPGTPTSDYRSNRVWPTLFDPAGSVTSTTQNRYGAYRVGYRRCTLDLEVQWTGLNYHQQNASLCISGGTMSTNENISVDVWAGLWQNVFTNLLTGWKNVSVSSYLTSSNFTIRFRNANPLDVVQDSWQIDVCLLKLSNTTDEYTAEVEFTGSSNSQSWTGLVWLLDSSWDTGSVNVTIQVYNYTLGSYPSSGNGYVSYVSNATSYTDETKSQTITSGATQFRNSTSPYYWKIKIKGIKSTSTQFQMKIDWIELQDSYAYTGDNVLYKAWIWYTIQATGASGNPIPFTYASLYANGTTVTFQNATSVTPVPNPAWLRLDVNGTFQLQIRSASSSGETFVLFAAVGNIVREKTITQVAQQ